MRLAYADPPYPGQAKRHYRDDPRCAEVNFPALIDHLGTFDAWALSIHSPALRDILPMTPAGTRVMAWVKPFCSFKPGVPVAYAWEPVLVHGARGTPPDTTRDWISANITLRRGLTGAKPREFCLWLFRVLGATAGDDFTDLFPGSGAVTAAWHEFIGQRPAQLALEAHAT